MYKLSFIQKLEQKLLRIFPTNTIKSKAIEPIISISFDDFPLSAAIEAKNILESKGLLATYYLAAGLLDDKKNSIEPVTREKVVELFEAGHEVGCHTYSHLNCSYITKKSRSVLRDDLLKNYKFIDDLIGISPVSFSYPFGGISFSSRKEVNRLYMIARGIDSGVNSNKIALTNLKANSIYSNNIDFNNIKNLINETKKTKGWCIFYTHDVCESPSSYGCSLHDFKHLIDLIVESNIQVLPIKNALGKISFG